MNGIDYCISKRIEGLRVVDKCKIYLIINLWRNILFASKKTNRIKRQSRRK